ncbi:MAG: efflux RND transporter permease subunit [Planctomycetota bacterium]
MDTKISIPEKLARWIQAHRIPVLAFFVLLSVPSFLLLFSVRIDNSSDIWFREKSDRFKSYRRFLEEFGSDRLFVVAYENADLFSPQALATLETLSRKLRELEEVEKVVDLPSSVVVNWTLMGPRVRTFAEAVSEAGADAERAKTMALAEPLFEGNLVTPDGRTAIVYVAIGPGVGLEGKRNVVEDVHALLATMDPAGGSFTVGGIPFIEVEFDRLTRRENAVFIPLSLCMIVLTVFFLFRSIRVTVIVVPILCLGVAATITAYMLVGNTFNLVTALIPPLLLAIGVADTIHILVQYREELSRGDEAGEALTRTLVKMFRPCLFTSLTTSAGFFSLAVADIPPVQKAGIFGGLGILFVFILSFTAFPAALSFLPARYLEAGPGAKRFDGMVESFLRRTQAMASAGRWVIIPFAAVCVLLSVVGIFRIIPETNVIRFFKKSNPIRESWGVLEEKGVAITAIEVIFQGDPGTFHDPEKLARVREAQRRIEDPSEVVRTFSAADFLDHALAPSMRKMEGGARLKAWGAVLEKMRKKAEGGESFLSGFINEDGSRARLSARTHDGGSHERMRLVRWTKKTVEEEFPDLGEVEINGTAPLFAWVEELILESQKKMAVVAGISILLMTVLLLRSLRLSALAMVPNVLPVVVTLGLMGWAKIPLDAGTILIAGVAVGIAVDDTIHYLTRFGRERRAGLDVREALTKSHITVGHAIVNTSMVLFAGFAIIGFSSFRPIYTFGLLTGLTMILALLGDLLLLPALLLVFRRRGT